MASMTVRPVFKELAKIQKDISFPPSLNKTDYKQCRAYTQKSNRCKKPLSKNSQKEAAQILSDFRHITEYSEIQSVYGQMRKFITLTHCYVHGQGVLDAFDEWKTQRIADVSNFSSNISPISSSDSLDTWTEASIVESPAPSSPVLGTQEYNESGSDLSIEEEMKNLSIETKARNATRNMNNGYYVKAEELEIDWKKLGDVELPDQGAAYDVPKIYKTIEKPLGPRSMYRGILYIYGHTSIPGIFKIGFSRQSAEQRHKQPGNCYGIDTRIIYESQPFRGVRQAERIVHAVLSHKNIQVTDCPHCKGTHDEWFLTSEKEVRDTVECAESWLRKPVYIINRKTCKLSPRGKTILKSTFRFSMSELKKDISDDDRLNDASDVFAVSKTVTAIQKTSARLSYSLNTKKTLSRAQDDENFTRTLSKRKQPQAAPLARTVHALEATNVNESPRYRLRSQELSSDEEESQDEDSQELESDEEESQDEDSQELESDEGSQAEGSQELESDEEGSQAEGSQELDSDEGSQVEGSEEMEIEEEDSQDEGSEEMESDEEGSQPKGSSALARRQPSKASSGVDSDILTLLMSGRYRNGR
ncbi:hypothetical protein M441DRAFT_60498 [Trichoderma asperellum CBS 433.97]|uniref:Bacteriophage T5 Orf172 DNA-binding domain-containing protein n=1 Tax=Trichoderma asperellum (strain ATCC 204424 / CBS 433.97 / NBRC 101777) TaxID=1042311 RepID=A0A2T3Z0A1_TRIA4|nr:hypothetical protein M441DRAFT_60498 [Trichoderma asperellum CBS 433.97]PTB38238.1 hypothetical protein M441DRAFT_60498 [Trichoderma asperellum CBS 433.97]